MRHPVLIRLLALLAYPLLVAVAMLLDQAAIRALGLPLLVVAAVGPWPGDRHGRLLILASLAMAVVVLAIPVLALWPPGLICVAAATWFGLSLRQGRQPMIERFARAVQAHRGDPLPPDSLAWLRAWTWVWTIQLAVLGSFALLLAARDQAALWLVWVSLVIPGFALISLIAEYWLRRLRFPEDDHWTLAQFLGSLARIRPEQLPR